MKTINALELQERLRENKYISIPWLQVEYDMEYRDAKALINQLAIRGWVQMMFGSNKYKVIKDNLLLRKIKKSEVDDLIEEIDMEGAAALIFLCRMIEDGATIDDLEDEMGCDEDAAIAVDLLRNHELIYDFNGLYFSRVSEETAKVLMTVVRAKRQRDMIMRVSGEKKGSDEIRQLFKHVLAD